MPPKPAGAGPAPKVVGAAAKGAVPPPPKVGPPPKGKAMGPPPAVPGPPKAPAPLLTWFDAEADLTLSTFRLSF